MYYICSKNLKNKRFGGLRMRIKLLFAFLVLFCFLPEIKAQRHEIGVQLGMSNLVGDIGKTSYILQGQAGRVSDFGLPIYAGVLYRMNVNPYQTIRLNVGYSNIQFNDNQAKENYRRMRKLWGTNSILEADLLFEYNFLPVNEEQKSMISPYIFGGIGGLYMNTSKPTLTIDKNANVTAIYAQGHGFTMAIPFGIGLKYKFNYNWAISGEFTFRPTFSDQVDYSTLKEKDINIKSTALSDEQTAIVVQDFLMSRNIGNINSKDWINSASLILSYSFGRPPCYCK